MDAEEKIYLHKDFEAHLEAEFTLSQEGVDQTLPIKLIEARLLDHAPPEGMRHGFSLLFQLPPETPLEQGVYTITNEEFGETSLFMVSVQPNQVGSLMEAVFN